MDAINFCLITGMIMLPLAMIPCDACHEKTDLKVFVVVIPKEGWAHMAAPILLLVWHPLFRIGLCWHHRLYSRKSWCHAKRRMDAANMTTTKTLRSVFSWCMSCNYWAHLYDILNGRNIQYMLSVKFISTWMCIVTHGPCINVDIFAIVKGGGGGWKMLIIINIIIYISQS